MPNEEIINLRIQEEGGDDLKALLKFIREGKVPVEVEITNLKSIKEQISGATSGGITAGTKGAGGSIPANAPLSPGIDASFSNIAKGIERQVESIAKALEKQLEVSSKSIERQTEAAAQAIERRASAAIDRTNRQAEAQARSEQRRQEGRVRQEIRRIDSGAVQYRRAVSGGVSEASYLASGDPRARQVIERARTLPVQTPEALRNLESAQRQLNRERSAFEAEVRQFRAQQDRNPINAQEFARLGGTRGAAIVSASASLPYTTKEVAGALRSEKGRTDAEEKSLNSLAIRYRKAKGVVEQDFINAAVAQGIDAQDIIDRASKLPLTPQELVSSVTPKRTLGGSKTAKTPSNTGFQNKVASYILSAASADPNSFIAAGGDPAIVAEAQRVGRVPTNREVLAGFRIKGGGGNGAAANQKRLDRITKAFNDETPFEEFFAGITGGEAGRQRVRTERINKLVSDNAGVVGLNKQLAAQKAPGFFQPGNLKKTDVLSQIAFAGVFGGLPGAVAAGAAAVTPLGKSGALLASTVQQAAGVLLDPIIQAFHSKEEEFKQSGFAFQRSILGITSVLQQSTTVLGPGGKPLGERNIAAQLAFQEKTATQIQLAARAKLLPLGIGGSTESTFVQGIVASLNNRGFNTQDSGKVANIAQNLGALIKANQPQLLENPTLLLRDLQDYLSGLPQAQRTLLGSIGRGALPAVAKARNIEGIDVALQRYAAYVTAVNQSENVAAIQGRVTGARERLSSEGGIGYTDAIKPALKQLAATLNDPEVVEAQKKLGTAIGNIAAAGIRLESIFSKLGSVAIKVADAIGALNPTEFLGQGIDEAAANKIEEANKGTLEAIQTLQAGQAVTSRRAQIESLLGGAGLEDIKNYGAGQSKTAENQLVALRQLRGIENFGEETPPATIAAATQEILQRAFEDRTRSGFGGIGGGLAKESLFRNIEIPKQAAEIEAEIRGNRKAYNDQLRQVGTQPEKVVNAQLDLIKAQAKEDTATKKAAATSKLRFDISEEEDARRRFKELSSPFTLPFVAGSRAVGALFGAKAPVTESQVREQQATANRELAESKQGVSAAKKALADVNKFDFELEKALNTALGSEKKRLDLVEKETESARISADYLSKAAESFRGAFGGTTAEGAESEARLRLKFGTAAAGKATQAYLGSEAEVNGLSNRVAQLQEELKTTQFTGAIQSQIDLVTKEKAGKQLNLELAGADVRKSLFSQFQAESDLRDRNLVAGRARLGGIDTGTFAGQILSGQENVNLANAGVANRQADIGQLQAKLSGLNPSSIEASTIRQRIEQLQQQSAAGSVQAAQAGRGVVQAEFAQEEGGLQLNKARRDLNALIDDEVSKRRELNASLKASTDAIKNFGQSANAKVEGAELDLAEQLNALEAKGVLVTRSFSPDQLEAARTRNQVNKANLTATELGLGQVAYNPPGAQLPLGLINPGGSPLQRQLDEERSKLSDSIRDTRKAIANLPEDFNALSVALRKLIADLESKFGIAEPGKSQAPGNTAPGATAGASATGAPGRGAVVVPGTGSSSGILSLPGGAPISIGGLTTRQGTPSFVGPLTRQQQLVAAEGATNPFLSINEARQEIFDTSNPGQGIPSFIGPLTKNQQSGANNLYDIGASQRRLVSKRAAAGLSDLSAGETSAKNDIYVDTESQRIMDEVLAAQGSFKDRLGLGNPTRDALGLGTSRASKDILGLGGRGAGEFKGFSEAERNAIYLNPNAGTKPNPYIVSPSLGAFGAQKDVITATQEQAAKKSAAAAAAGDTSTLLQQMVDKAASLEAILGRLLSKPVPVDIGAGANAIANGVSDAVGREL